MLINLMLHYSYLAELVIFTLNKMLHYYYLVELDFFTLNKTGDNKS